MEEIKSVIIEWKGPYTLEELRTLGVGNGIYLLTGQKKRSRSHENQLQYCGITERGFYDRLCRNHPKKEMIRPDSLKIWLGLILHPVQSDREYLEHIEHCLVSFWAVHMNEKKTCYLSSKTNMLSLSLDATQWPSLCKISG